MVSSLTSCLFYHSWRVELSRHCLNAGLMKRWRKRKSFLKWCTVTTRLCSDIVELLCMRLSLLHTCNILSCSRVSKSSSFYILAIWKAFCSPPWIEAKHEEWHESKIWFIPKTSIAGRNNINHVFGWETVSSPSFHSSECLQMLPTDENLMKTSFSINIFTHTI